MPYIKRFTWRVTTVTWHDRCTGTPRYHTRRDGGLLLDPSKRQSLTSGLDIISQKTLIFSSKALVILSPAEIQSL